MTSQGKILLGLTAGAGGGVAANLLWGNTPALTRVITYAADPLGQIFLRLLLMIVLPLIFTSVCLAVASFEKPRELARVGGKTLGWFVLMAALGAMLGIVPVSLTPSGTAFDSSQQKEFVAAYAIKGEPQKAPGEDEKLGISMLVNLVPANIFDAAAHGELVGVLLFALILGAALSRVASEKKKSVLRVLEGVDRALFLMVGFVMYLAPVGVAALMFAAAARFGFSMLRFLGQYLVVLLVGLLLYESVVLGGLAWLLARVKPAAFFRGSWLPIATAFATGSSSATLPTTMRAAEDELGVSREITQFVLPLSATMSRGGTALFAVITVLFVAQVFGISVTVNMRIWLAILATITALGVAGIPAGAVPLLTFLLAVIGAPQGAIALVLGVEQVTGMARTVPNVTGGILTALLIEHSGKRAGASVEKTLEERKD